MSTSVASKGPRQHSKTIRRGSPSLWLKIASTPAYLDMACMSSREPTRKRVGDLDPIEPQTW